MSERSGKRELRQLTERIIKAKKRELSLWRKMQSDIETQWSNAQFAGLLTVTNSWGCLQRNPAKDFPNV